MTTALGVDLKLVKQYDVFGLDFGHISGLLFAMPSALSQSWLPIIRHTLIVITFLLLHGLNCPHAATSLFAFSGAKKENWVLLFPREKMRKQSRRWLLAKACLGLGATEWLSTFGLVAVPVALGRVGRYQPPHQVTRLCNGGLIWRWLLPKRVVQ